TPDAYEESCRAPPFVYGQNRNFTSHAPTDTYSHTHARTCTHRRTHARTHARTPTHHPTPQHHTHTPPHTLDRSLTGFTFLYFFCTFTQPPCTELDQEAPSPSHLHS